MRDKLLSWVRTRLLSPTSRVDRILLTHVTIDGPGSVLCTIERQKEACDLETEVQAIVNELFTEATDHVESGPRAQRYAVLVYSGPNMLSQKQFKLSPTPDGGPHIDTEPPTPQGALSMSMRLASEFARMNQQGFGALLTTALEENERLRRRNASLEQRLDESFEVREALRSQEHERQMDLLTVERRNDRWDRLIDQLKPMIPMLVPKLMGSLLKGLPVSQQKEIQKELPKSTVPSTEDLIKKFMFFFETLTEEQMTKIFDILTTEQQEKLAEIVFALKSEEQELSNVKGS